MFTGKASCADTLVPCGTWYLQYVQKGRRQSAQGVPYHLQPATMHPIPDYLSSVLRFRLSEWWRVATNGMP